MSTFACILPISNEWHIASKSDKEEATRFICLLTLLKSTLNLIITVPGSVTSKTGLGCLDFGLKLTTPICSKNYIVYSVKVHIEVSVRTTISDYISESLSASEHSEKYENQV